MHKQEKKLILVITPHKKGGPWQWGADLVNELNKNSEFRAEHIFKIRDKFFSPFRPGVRLIHTTNPLAFSIFLRPIILTVHGKIYGPFWKFFYWIGRFQASIVTVPSEFLKKSLNFKKAIVIPNAINLTKFIEVDLMSRDYFNRKINWRIVGFGPLLEDVKKSVSNLDKPKNVNVQWFGFDLPQKYFSDSDIFAYFSYEDNMPIAIMEAMASGLPVVTNNHGAASEIISYKKD